MTEITKTHMTLVTFLRSKFSFFVVLFFGACCLPATCQIIGTTEVCVGQSYTYTLDIEYTDCVPQGWVTPIAGAIVQSSGENTITVVWTDISISREIQYRFRCGNPRLGIPVTTEFSQLGITSKIKPVVVNNTYSFESNNTEIKVNTAHPDYVYQWKQNGAVLALGPFMFWIATTTRNITLEANVCNQIQTTSAIQHVFPKPTLSKSGNISASTSLITLSAPEYPASALAEYTWYKNDVIVSKTTIPSLQVTTTGNYHVNVKLANGNLNSNVVDVSMENKTYPATNVSYTYTQVYKIKTKSILPVSTNSQTSNSYIFLNGDGSAKQTVSIAATALGNDIVSFSSSPVVNREFTTYNSIVIPSSEAVSIVSDPKAKVMSYYSNPPIGLYNTEEDKSTTVSTDVYPFAVSKLDQSPLARVLASGQQGKKRQLNTQHVVKTRKEILKTHILTGKYIGNQLHLLIESPSQKFITNKIVDENNIVAYEVFDKRGNKVQVLNKIENNAFARTALIYDEMDQLKLQISPEGVRQILNSNNGLNSNYLIIANDYGTLNNFDDKGRMVEQKLPGSELLPTKYIYDRLGRVVMVQDAEHAQTNTWLYTKYDVNGRVALTGQMTTTHSRETLQQLFDAHTGPVYETRTTHATTHYYTSASFPNFRVIPNSNIIHKVTIANLSINLYDTYDLNQNGTPDFIPSPSQVVSTAKSIPHPLGLATVLYNKPTGINALNQDSLCSYTFYNADASILQQSKQIHRYNYQNLNMATKSMYFNRDKSILFTETVVPGYTPIVEKVHYNFAGQPESYWINENLVTQYKFNELGNLIEKNLYQRHDGTFIQSVDYRYDLLGRLRSINNKTLTNNGGGTNDDNNDLFGLEIGYEEEPDALGNSGIYGSLPLQVSWAMGSIDSIYTYQYAYGKTYQLLQGNFSKAHKNTPQEKVRGDYSESFYQTDYDGNAKQFKRTGPNRLLIDSVSVEHRHGHTYHAVDWAQHNKFGFQDKPSAVGAQEYFYAKNGRLIKDENERLDYKFNTNRAQEEIANMSTTVKYVLDAQGNQLEKRVVQRIIPGYDSTTTTYVFNLELSGGELTMEFEDGTVSWGGTSSSPWRFFLKDHEGSVRVVVDGTGQLLERKNYYPSGMLSALHNESLGEKTSYGLMGKQALTRELGVSYYSNTDDGKFDPESIKPYWKPGKIPYFFRPDIERIVAIYGGSGSKYGSGPTDPMGWTRQYDFIGHFAFASFNSTMSGEISNNTIGFRNDTWDKIQSMLTFSKLSKVSKVYSAGDYFSRSGSFTGYGLSTQSAQYADNIYILQNTSGLVTINYENQNFINAEWAHSSDGGNAQLLSKFDYNESNNQAMLGNITQHYIREAGFYIPLENISVEEHSGAYAHATYQGKISISTENGKIDPNLNNKWFLMNTLVHELYHYNFEKVDRSFDGHIWSYVGQREHYSWKHLDERQRGLMRKSALAMINEGGILYDYRPQQHRIWTNWIIQYFK